jgi:hypothetical protein
LPWASVADGGGSGGTGVTRMGGFSYGRTNTIDALSAGGTHGGGGGHCRVAHLVGVDAARPNDGLRQGAHQDHQREPLPGSEGWA